MIRTPLRPLARILEARATGQDPRVIENRNIRARQEDMREVARNRAEGRLLVLGLFFFCAFAVIGLRMGALATSTAEEPRRAGAGAAISAARADIVDRRGRLLASNMETHALYAQPHIMIDPQKAAAELAQIFPELDHARLLKDFTGKRKFLWLKGTLSPEQRQAVHDIGEPGLLFGAREMRLYPNGRLASHILGGTQFGEQGVHAAELMGIAGVERSFDERLRDPARVGEPLELSIDLSVQAVAERVLYGGMRLMNAKGASLVLMDVHTGEVISAVSLPDFDPNFRPVPKQVKDQSDSPLFNRYAQGVYELGSTFKVFTAVQALDLGLVRPETSIDTGAPLRVGGFSIGEFQGKNYGDISVEQIIVKSSNRGSGRLAMMIGAEQQKAFLTGLGLLTDTPFELSEARGAHPQTPKRWTELSTVTISYGHGVSTTPLHLAAGYAALANGGYAIKPTLLRQDAPRKEARLMSPQAARAGVDMLRKVVSEGTASMGEVPGYGVGGKTGTADKPKPSGGYYEDKVIATFASIFPSHDPQYVLVVTLDEPTDTTGEKPRRTAGWTAVPVAAELIKRIAPLLNVAPEFEADPLLEPTYTASE